MRASSRDPVLSSMLITTPPGDTEKMALPSVHQNLRLPSAVHANPVDRRRAAIHDVPAVRRPCRQTRCTGGRGHPTVKCELSRMAGLQVVRTITASCFPSGEIRGPTSYPGGINGAVFPAASSQTIGCPFAAHTLEQGYWRATDLEMRSIERHPEKSAAPQVHQVARRQT